MDEVKNNNFTEGPIMGPLLKFAVPILLAMLLQSAYGAVDLLIVGRFGTSADISGVATGSQFMHLVLSIGGGFATAVTVLLGQKLGEKRPEEATKVLGSAVCFFGLVAIVMTVVSVGFPGLVLRVMNVPAEALGPTRSYILICGWGILFILAYNLIGSIFRGLGDSKVPLMAVGIACVLNIFGDLFLVAVMGMGAAGAAIATVAAQLFSVVFSLLIIRRRALPMSFGLHDIAVDKPLTKRIFRLGFPISLQSVLVSISFTVVMAIVNSMGLTASAGVGVAEKLASFVILVPYSCSQAISAFVAHNVGAGRHDRARKSLLYLVLTSLCLSVVIAWFSFFHGDILAGIFAEDTAVIAAGAEYLKAYAFDCLLTCFLFSFLGFYSGYGQTGFTLVQGLVGAFMVRIPVAFLMSREAAPSLFRVGLATPASTATQIVLCFAYLAIMKRRHAFDMAPADSLE